MRVGWLYQARRAAGLKTQDDFVDALAARGVYKAKTSISTWESAGTLPASILGNPTELIPIAQVLKLSISDILRNSGFTDFELQTEIDPEIIALANLLQLADLDTRASLLEAFMILTRSAVSKASPQAKQLEESEVSVTNE